MTGSASDSPAVLQIHDLRVERAGRTVIAGVDIRLGPTERLAIEGSIGSGKSSLLWAALGLLDFSGAIEILGMPCQAERDFVRVRGAAALLFQDPDEQLIGPSVLDDVMFGPLNLGLSQEVSEQRAREALAQLGLNELMHRPVRGLSGGQKRLVALAGILSMQPKLLLLDEPTAGLDAETGRRVTGLLAQLSLPMLLVSHDEYCLDALATRRRVLQEGRLIERPTHRVVDSTASPSFQRLERHAQ